MTGWIFASLALASSTFAMQVPGPTHHRDFEGRSRKLLVVAIDGLRPDALATASTPALDSLIARGCYSPRARCEDLTFSGPNHSSILHGVHRDKHNVTTNTYSGNNLGQYPDFLAYLEQHNPAWNTFRIVTWSTSHQNQPTGADVAFLRNYTSNGDALMTQDAVQLFSGSHPTYPQDPDVLFLFYSDVDVAGHTHGFHPSVSGYLDEIEDTDAQLGQILTALRNRPTFSAENWLILLTTDHGGSINGSHSSGQPQDREIPFLVSGPSAVRGIPFPEPRNVDVAATALTFMGVAIDPTWDLDSRAVGLEHSAAPVAQFGQNLIFNGDAEYDRGFLDVFPDQAISGWEDLELQQMTLIEYNAPNGYPTSSDPGPPARGKNFFVGGSGGPNTIKQDIDLTPLSVEIDAVNVGYEFSTYLGGFSSQDDQATAKLRFLDSNDNVLLLDILGPVDAAARGNSTGLLLRQNSGMVPSGARVARITLRAILDVGLNDGYADDLELVLQPLALGRRAEESEDPRPEAWAAHLKARARALQDSPPPPAADRGTPSVHECCPRSGCKIEHRSMKAAAPPK
jgi:hypothetical protein